MFLVISEKQSETAGLVKFDRHTTNDIKDLQQYQNA